MKDLRAWVLCLLLLGLALRGAAREAVSRAPQLSMGMHTPDIDPAWYTGRRIRPVGRFGRRRLALRRLALRNVPKLQLAWPASPWKAALSPPRVGDSPAPVE